MHNNIHIPCQCIFSNKKNGIRSLQSKTNVNDIGLIRLFEQGTTLTFHAVYNMKVLLIATLLSLSLSLLEGKPTRNEEWKAFLVSLYFKKKKKNLKPTLTKILSV